MALFVNELLQWFKRPDEEQVRPRLRLLEEDISDTLCDVEEKGLRLHRMCSQDGDECVDDFAVHQFKATTVVVLVFFIGKRDEEQWQKLAIIGQPLRSHASGIEKCVPLIKAHMSSVYPPVQRPTL
jgi:hypothetical protein